MTEEHLSHSHSHSDVNVPVSQSHKKILRIVVGIVLFMMTVGIVMTWPSTAAVKKTTSQVRSAVDFADAQYSARVDSIEERICDGMSELPKKDQVDCEYYLFDVLDRTVTVREGVPCIKNQPYTKDQTQRIRFCAQQSFDPRSPTKPDLSVGDKLVVSYRSSDVVAPSYRYSYADQDRRIPLVLIVILFLIAVILFGAWRGFFAVLGLIVSLLIIGVYILPALVAGESGVLVALAGGTAVAAAALYLAHGIKESTHIAFLSSILAVMSIAALAQIFFALGKFTGLVSEEASFLATTGANIDLRGLLIAGVILASLGALDDMTVTQVAAVSEIHNARPDYRFAQLWKSAVRIGRDHVASTVNTLALAYVGTSLAVMALFVVADLPFQWIANSESVAVEIMGALVGSIGLIIAVPFSTALAAYIVHHSGEHEHDHDHEGDHTH